MLEFQKDPLTKMSNSTPRGKCPKRGSFSGRECCWKKIQKGDVSVQNGVYFNEEDWRNPTGSLIKMGVVFLGGGSLKQQKNAGRRRREFPVGWV